MLVAGTEHFWAVVKVTAVDDGQVHFVQLTADDREARALLARAG